MLARPSLQFSLCSVFCLTSFLQYSVASAFQYSGSQVSQNDIKQVKFSLSDPDQEPQFVGNLTGCPPLIPRKEPPQTVHDLRPDDFSVVMAVGDSISAAALAEGYQVDIISSLAEWRGRSYASGGDPGAITIPNLLRHYNPSIRGASLGKNLVLELCLGPICAPTGWNSEVDQLNAARSGALARNLLHEIRDYLVPQLAKKNISDGEFKYLNFQIGSNDLCQMCLADIFTWNPGPGTPSSFEDDVIAALEYVRLHIPNTVVNLIGVFRVSDVYKLTRGHYLYCHKFVRDLPRYTFECACALQDGPLGEFYRHQMDLLQEKYNERLLKIVKAYQQLNDPTFAVMWQPAVIPLADFPIEAVSDVDCFHPSTANHQRIASGIWNRLTLNATERTKDFAWSEKIMLRCLQDDDRLQTRTSWDFMDNGPPVV